MNHKRRLSNREAVLISYLISKANYRYDGDISETLFVTEMDDGGMGSLELYPNNEIKEKRSFGKIISECQFRDVDWVPVSACLLVDKEDRLFELDMFKGDGSKLICIPEKQYYDLSTLRYLANQYNIGYKQLRDYYGKGDRIAISLNDSLYMIEILRQRLFPILGGNILKYESNQFSHTHINWSCDVIEPYSDFVKRSCDIARREIEEVISTYSTNEKDGLYVYMTLFNESGYDDV